MNVKISSNIVIENYTMKLLKWCEDNLVVENSKYKQLKMLKKDFLIKKYHIQQFSKIYKVDETKKTLTIPFGCLRAIWFMIKDSNMSWDFNQNHDISIKDVPCAIDLYDYQKDAVNVMVKNKGGVLVSPCGSGKTIMGIEIVRRIGKPFIWLVHTGDLLRQAYKDFIDLYPDMDIGLITEGDVNFGQDGVISTVQTLSNLDVKLYKDKFDVVIVDECIHANGTGDDKKMFQKILDNIPARYKFGLTATPYRSDDLIKTMYSLIGTNAMGQFDCTHKVPKELVKIIVAEHVKFELDTPINDDDFVSADHINFNNVISYLVNDDDRTKTIVDNIVKCHDEGRKQVVLSGRIEHCKKINEMLTERGIKSQIIIGASTTKKRDSVLNEKEDWSVIISTYSLLKEGVSIKSLDTLHLITPIVNQSSIVQCVGRIERYKENKLQPIVYDYVDINSSYCMRCYNEREKILIKRF